MPLLSQVRKGKQQAPHYYPKGKEESLCLRTVRHPDMHVIQNHQDSNPYNCAVCQTRKAKL